MKKLILLSMVLFAASGCVRDDGAGAGLRTDSEPDLVPLFYGVATLPDAAPATRGVANTLRVWSRPAAKNITVKFLNGSESYQDYVRTVAKEWEKYADVKFQFVPDSVDAIVRIGFDYVRGMQSSWAYTGTDHMALYNQQDVPTIHYAQWRRAADALKRSDVLRSFGQVLGLELEYRHPSCTPGWITANGQIDEQTIREYWEYELAEVISWEELKTFVLDPLADNIFLVKTPNYDENSVMNWPFYEQIANNLPLIEYDSDYKTELSVQDKIFIAELYGAAIPPEDGGGDDIVPTKRTLVSFNNTASQVEFTVTVTKDVVFAYSLMDWSEPLEYEEGEIERINDGNIFDPIPFYKELVRIEVPEGMDEYTTTVSYEFEGTPLRDLQIFEVILNNEWDKPSMALRKFDLTMGTEITNLSIRPANGALESVRIVGNAASMNQNFLFSGLANLKEVFLKQVGNSKVTLKNCPKLETFATSPTIWKPGEEDTDQNALIAGAEADLEFDYIPKANKEFPPFIRDSMIVAPPQYYPWPLGPEIIYSLSDEGGAGLTIENCPALKTVSLDHTRINELNFGNMPNMEYLYLSSDVPYIAGGGIVRSGEYLYNTIKTLPARLNLAPGMVVVRGMRWYRNAFYPSYDPVKMDRGELIKIDKWLDQNNWSVVFERGYRNN